jgi:photosystem II stability/assembly factor-like uncharacterized protein
MFRKAIVLLFALGSTAQAQTDPALWKSLKFRHIGPEGNRVTSVSGVVGDPMTYYAGAASGGIFKTTDGGIHWSPIFDSMPVSSIGSLAVSASDHNVVWAGTGEPFIRSTISLGWGVYRSTDAGKTWAKMGLDLTGRIGRIAIDPRNPDNVLVAALGHAYGPQPERGIYRTTDGGKTWARTLFVNDSTGAIDVVMNPANPRIAYAATWQIEIHTWGRRSGGAGSGIWKTTDGGATWTRLKNGLPTTQFGKVGLAVAPSNPDRVYALIETTDSEKLPGVETDSGELWRSDDGGDNWTVVSHDRELAGRTQYYSRMAVASDNDLEAYFATANFAKTLDGGKTTIDPPFAEIPGGDHHDIWIDPKDANRIAVSHDGGVSITVNRGKTWNQVQLPIAQIYHVTTDTKVPYYVYGNMQDGPSSRGPSNSRAGGIARGMWHSVGGGESGWATPDPENPDLIWSTASGFGSVGGIVTRYDVKTGITNSVEVWPMATFGWGAADLKYRFVWTFPLTISPHDHNKVYVGSQHVHVTTDGGRNWREISPDLTRNDKSRQQASGGLTPDNVGVEYSGVVFAIAESRLKAGLLWVGTNDGLVHVSEDGGGSWKNVTANIPGLLPWGTISNIEASRFDASTAYLSVDGHQENNRDPWIYKTTDLGRTWKLIVNGIPKSPLSYVHQVKEDPVRRGLLYAGTENALYVSFDDGGSWQTLQNNLPHAPVHGITIQEHFNDLALATYGRGMWILDDITPLRQLTSAGDGERRPAPCAARGVSVPLHRSAASAGLRSGDRAGSALWRGHQLLDQGLDDEGLGQARDPRWERRRGAEAHADQERRAQPGLVGSFLRALETGQAAESAGRRAADSDSGRRSQFARRRHGGDPGAAGDVHRATHGRDEAAHPATRSAEGSQLGWKRRGDRDPDSAPEGGRGRPRLRGRDDQHARGNPGPGRRAQGLPGQRLGSYLAQDRRRFTRGEGACR